MATGLATAPDQDLSLHSTTTARTRVPSIAVEYDSENLGDHGLATGLATALGEDLSLRLEVEDNTRLSGVEAENTLVDKWRNCVKAGKFAVDLSEDELDPTMPASVKNNMILDEGISSSDSEDCVLIGHSPTNSEQA